MLKVLQAGAPAEVRDRILANLKQFLPGKWRDLQQSPEFSQTLDRLFELRESRTTALALIEAAARSDYLGKVAALAADQSEWAATRSPCIATWPA